MASRSVKTIRGTRLSMRTTGEADEHGQQRWDVYLTTEPVAHWPAEVVKLPKPHLVGTVVITPVGRGVFVAILGRRGTTQVESLTAAGRFLGQLAELGLI